MGSRLHARRAVQVTRVVEPAQFRHALGHFCTGVTVVAAVGADGEPVGFACQSFAALSLEPPLILFCPGKSSRTWPLIEGINNHILNGDLYKALKEAKKLIAYEAELLESARRARPSGAASA